VTSIPTRSRKEHTTDLHCFECVDGDGCFNNADLQNLFATLKPGGPFTDSGPEPAALALAIAIRCGDLAVDLLGANDELHANLHFMI
jgi:hypothetical protein